MDPTLMALERQLHAEQMECSLLESKISKLDSRKLDRTIAIKKPALNNTAKSSQQCADKQIKELEQKLRLLISRKRRQQNNSGDLNGMHILLL
jgi:hypothetical protein